MLESDIIWQLTHKLETNQDYNTLYDGSKKFNNLKSASHGESNSTPVDDNSVLQADLKSTTGIDIVKEADEKSVSLVSVSGTSNISKLISPSEQLETSHKIDIN